MNLPRVVAVTPGSPAAAAGLLPGDEILTVGGRVPRDVIQYQLLTAEPDVELEVERGGLQLSIAMSKEAGQPLGAEIESALFDRVRTCDNHCEFCFIYQLPKGMRRSLYMKDDDYRLSFLYGNFTTLTRFTEADLERVVTERLSPLYVSIHATDPDTRSRMLRNRRGATSLRWLRALLDHDIEVHGQVVMCPGINDGDVLEDTLVGVLDQYPELASLAVVPLGVSRHSDEAAMRPHTEAEAVAVVEAVEDWQSLFLQTLGRRLVFAADEYYLLAHRPFPGAATYEGFPMTEDGIGLARLMAEQLLAPGQAPATSARQSGFFDAVDGAPAAGYRAARTLIPVRGVEASGGTTDSSTAVALAERPIAILTGEYGARVLEPALERAGFTDVRLVAVRNDFFGGNVAVTGLLTGADLTRTLADQPEDHRYLLPDVCLTNGVFLDGISPSDLPRPVEIVATDGASLRTALLGRSLVGTARNARG